ncbi:hypothetical protein LUX01_03625 [Streptomyces sudanensis]|nr:hypothetical protein [Streptomyces sudanensis]MCP9985927.1 hypothetical protein [Streptomyces sudanensis]
MPTTDAAANWADPAKVVKDMAMGAAIPMSAARATTPKDTAKPKTAIASGTAMRSPRSHSSLKPAREEYPSDASGGAGNASWESIGPPVLRRFISTDDTEP